MEEFRREDLNKYFNKASTQPILFLYSKSSQAKICLKDCELVRDCFFQDCYGYSVVRTQFLFRSIFITDNIQENNYRRSLYQRQCTSFQMGK